MVFIKRNLVKPKRLVCWTTGPILGSIGPYLGCICVYKSFHTKNLVLVPLTAARVHQYGLPDRFWCKSDQIKCCYAYTNRKPSIQHSYRCESVNFGGICFADSSETKGENTCRYLLNCRCLTS